MKRITLLLVALVGFAFTMQAQTVKVQLGRSFNRTVVNQTSVFKPDAQNSNGNSYFLGVDYLHLLIFNLSSNVGLVSKDVVFDNYKLLGSTVDGLANVPQYTFGSSDFLMINTQVNLNLPIPVVKPFIAVGPQYGFAVNKSDEMKQVFEKEAAKDNVFGLLCGVGIKVNILKFHAGIRADYFYDFDRKIEAGDAKSYNDLFTTNLTLGFKF